MTIHRRIMERLGCRPGDATKVELAARLINRREMLKTVEDLTPDEFASLIDRAVELDKALASRIRSYLEGDRS